MIIIHAINKYGEESFSISEVEKVICDSQEELQNLLNTKEIYYIAYYNSLRPNGYNITKVGIIHLQQQCLRLINMIIKEI